MRPLLPLLGICALLSITSCSSTRNESINQFIGNDFMALSDSDYRLAVKALSTATKIDYPVLSDRTASRDTGPWQVLALDEGAVVVGALQGALQLSYVNKMGKRVWQENVTLGKYQVGKQLSLEQHESFDVACLRVAVDMGVCQTLIFALNTKGCTLIRAETKDGQFAGTAFAENLPIYKYSKVKIESSSGADSLAALMRLSGEAAKMERSVAAVRSQLEAFSSSTDVWVAEAAASVLTLPSH